MLTLKTEVDGLAYTATILEKEEFKENLSYSRQIVIKKVRCDLYTLEVYNENGESQFIDEKFILSAVKILYENFPVLKGTLLLDYQGEHREAEFMPY